MKDNLLFFQKPLPKWLLTDGNSTISQSSKHFKHLPTTLKWAIQSASQLTINHPIGYEVFNGNGMDLSRASFVVYLYNETPIQDTLCFSFQTDHEEACSFEMNMQFTGWRSSWVMFERDMVGTPVETMNQLVIKAPQTFSGHSIYFGLMILATPLDGRHHTRTPQVPFVNKMADEGANSHWMSLLTYYEAYEKYSTKRDKLNHEKHQISIATIKKRYAEHLATRHCTYDFETLQKNYESYHIVQEKNRITGKSIDYHCAKVIFNAYKEMPQVQEIVSIDLKAYTQTMYHAAYYYHNQDVDHKKREQAKQMFITMYQHLQDQGVACGSDVGTVHHLGYALRDYYYPSLYWMHECLEEEGLLQQAQQAMNWFSGMGRIFYEELSANGVNMDVLNTELEGMLLSILLEKEDKQAQLMTQFTQWLTFACSHKPGLSGPFKKDGSGYHHMNLYPAYAKEGLEGVTFIIYLLKATTFRLLEAQHQCIKKAVLQFRLYSNKTQYLVSLSGRHPRGTESLALKPFKYMALAGTPDGKCERDEEVASAYMRLVDGQEDELATYFAKCGIQKEDAPQGHWSLNYGCVALHRRKEWLVGVKGHSRYLWANESYPDANLYGRYISHGHVQIMSKGNPVTNQASGYVQEGWDFNSWPGTTAIEMPIDQLKARIIQVDVVGGIEEMLLSDETYCGGVTFENQQGLFAMKLHEHPKYNGSHRARKSVFMFDERIICIGTGIENTHKQYATYTTLFQNHLEHAENLCILDEKVLEVVPYEATKQLKKNMYIIDNKDNGYVIKANQEVVISKLQQHSFDQSKNTPTQGLFAKARINHGISPENASYEYMICVDTTKEKFQALKQRMEENEDAIYTVLQKDNQAHIVKDHETQIIGYALFEACDNIQHGILKSTDTPALIMTKQDGKACRLSVCDPDLRYYEGKDESQYEDGRQIEVSPYGLKWKKEEGKIHEITVMLKGKWEKLQEDDTYQLEINSDHTKISFKSQEALIKEMVLKCL